MMRTFLIGVFVLFSAPAAAKAVDASTETLRSRTVSDLYGGDKYRDPFARVSASASSASGAKSDFKAQDFSIHEVELRGIMRDKRGAYAILIDIETRAGLVLRKGRVYTFRNKRIPGVTGRINVAQKTVVLLTADKDVQTLHLGEDEDEDFEDEE